MLDAILTWAFAATIVTTVLLVAAGRSRHDGRRARRAVAVAIAVVSGVVAQLTTAADATAPLIVGVALAAVLTALPARWRIIGAAFFAALAVMSLAYAAVLVRSTVLLSGGPVGLALGAVLLVLELGAIGLILASAFEMVDALCSGLPAVAATMPVDPARWPVVCLQVPTYNEPPELVIETIRSLAAIDYPALRIQVIDNNTTDETLWRPVANECARLGSDGTAIEFVHLPEWPGYKGGALNWGRTHLAPDVEIVGVVDADYVVDPGWLRSTVPFFDDPLVGFVQTPQDYRAWESSAFYRACYVGFAYFFRVGMVSRAHRNAIIFAGTMGLIRRSTLDAVGGWDEQIITEDAEISLRVLARGERAVYVDRAFGRGIMPLSYEGLRKQRFRWAFGGIQILRRHWRTILGRRSGLTLGQRYDHLVGGLWWFNDALTFGFSLFVVATAIGVIVGRPFVVQRLTALGLILPIALIALNLVRYLWALRQATGAGPALALAALRVNLSLSWVIALACVRALTQSRGVFLRTPKFQGAVAIRELRVVWIEASLAAVALGLAALVFVRAGLVAPTATIIGLLVWMALIYGSAAGFALGDPMRAPIGDGLREKMALEIAPRVGRVARSRPARAGAAATILAVIALGALASESGRAPIEALPFRDLPAGGIDFGAGGGDRPAAEPPGSPLSSGRGSPSAPASIDGLASPSGGSGASPSGRPQSSLLPAPSPSPTPGPTAGVSARPTPPIPVSTPTAAPTPSVSARPSPPPRPSPSPPKHP